MNPPDTSPDPTPESALGGIGFVESVVLMVLMISLVALSIDAMLPALADIGRDLAVADPNDSQLVVSMLLLGMGLGQVIYGPLSDSIGRKPTIYLGVGIFITGCALSVTAADFTMMLLGRVLQGIGAAGPRTVIVALIRDQYEGRAMARILSLVMAVFILVPVLAPALGQAILFVAHWRWIFGLLLGLALIGLTWFALRQPETLAPEKRRPFRLGRIALAVKEACGHRVAFGYTLAGGVVFGAFLGYLNSAQQIFQQTYGLGELFPIYFGGLAIAIGGASYLNARLVMRFGMRLLSHRALIVTVAASLACLPLAWMAGGVPPLWLLMAYLAVAFFCFGLLFGNFNALAMEPLGHIAVVGAAVVGSLQTLISVVFGVAIGRAYDGGLVPLVTGFAVLGLMSMALMRWAEPKPKQ